jgi:hypothetical protein
MAGVVVGGLERTDPLSFLHLVASHEGKGEI